MELRTKKSKSYLISTLLIIGGLVSLLHYHNRFQKGFDWVENHQGYVNRSIYHMKIIEVRDYDDFVLVGLKHVDEKPVKGFISWAILKKNNSQTGKKEQNYLIEGTELKVEGEFSLTRSYSNPGLLDPVSTLWANRKLGDFKIVETISWKLPLPFVQRAVEIQRKSIAYINNRIDSIYDGTYAGLIKAMVIGDKSTLDDSLEDNFKKHGLSHLLAISGLHVGILYLFLYKICLFLLRKPRKAFWITLVSLMIYNFLIGYHISCIRATLMLMVLNISIHYGKAYHNFRNLFLIFMINIIFRPWDLFHVGFLLSYTAVASLYLIYPQIKAFVAKYIKSHLVLSLIELVLVTLSVNIGTFPVLLTYFYGFSLISVFSNLLLVPLFIYQYVIGVTGLLFACIHMPLGRFIGGGSVALYKMYSLYFDLLGKDYYYYVGNLTVIEITLYYLLVYICISWLRDKAEIKRMGIDVKSRL